MDRPVIYPSAWLLALLEKGHDPDTPVPDVETTLGLLVQSNFENQYAKRLATYGKTTAHAQRILMHFVLAGTSQFLLEFQHNTAFCSTQVNDLNVYVCALYGLLQWVARKMPEAFIAGLCRDTMTFRHLTRWWRFPEHQWIEFRHNNQVIDLSSRLVEYRYAWCDLKSPSQAHIALNREDFKLLKIFKPPSDGCCGPAKSVKKFFKRLTS